MQESHKCPHSGVPLDHRGLPGLLHHDAAGGRLEVYDAVDVGRRELPGADGGEGSGLLSLLQHPCHDLH